MIKHKLEWRDGKLLIHLYDPAEKKKLDTIVLDIELNAMNEKQNRHFAMVGLRHWLSSMTLDSVDKTEQFNAQKRLITQMQKTGKLYNFRGKEI